MKYFLCCFLVFGLLLGCDDDEAPAPPANTDINIRLSNQSSSPLGNIQLRFDEQGLDADFTDYAPLSIGAESDYKTFDIAGECGTDFRARRSDDPQDTLLTVEALCLCICLLDPGFYTATITDIDGTDPLRLALEITED